LTQQQQQQQQQQHQGCLLRHCMGAACCHAIFAPGTVQVLNTLSAVLGLVPGKQQQQLPPPQQL
jgi:hypothetical protein